MKFSSHDTPLTWRDEKIPQEERERFIDECLTPSNLRRALWTIICFLPLSILFLLDNILNEGDRRLVALGAIDVVLSLSFFVAFWVGTKRVSAQRYRRSLVIAYYAFCLISVTTYYFLAYPTVGEVPLYLSGVILPAVLYQIPVRQAFGMMAIIHLVYTLLLVSSERSHYEFVAVWISGTFGILVACLAAHYLFSREWENYQQIRVIQRNNRQLIELNEQLEKQKLEMDDIMALAAHDLRSPLLEMKGLFDVLATKDQWNQPPFTEVLHSVRESCAQQLALLKSLLDSYRAEHQNDQLNRKSLDLVQLIKQIGLKLSSERNPVEFSSQEAAAHIVTDSTHILQILENLLTNAIKFSPSGTPILLTLSRLSSSWIIEVADSGPGVPKNERDQLFRKFSRASSSATTKQGAGLGLFIASRLIQNLGGEISYRARVPGGSIFTVSLPSKTQ